MWLLLAGILLSATEPWWGWPRGSVLWVTLVLVALGCALTVVTRLRAVARELRERG